MKFSASKIHVHPHSGRRFLVSHAFDQDLIKIEIVNALGMERAQGVFKDVVRFLKPARI